MTCLWVFYTMICSLLSLKCVGGEKSLSTICPCIKIVSDSPPPFTHFDGIYILEREGTPQETVCIDGCVFKKEGDLEDDEYCFKEVSKEISSHVKEEDQCPVSTPGRKATKGPTENGTSFLSSMSLSGSSTPEYEYSSKHGRTSSTRPPIVTFTNTDKNPPAKPTKSTAGEVISKSSTFHRVTEVGLTTALPVTSTTTSATGMGLTTTTYYGANYEMVSVEITTASPISRKKQSFYEWF